MKFLNSFDPIIACSTSMTSNSAIGIIRISGFDNFDKLNGFFNIDLYQIEPRKFYNSDLFFEETLLDKIMVVFFKSPQSYNGENILELNVHGNISNIKRIISFFNKAGIRSAEPGEFSYRALRNKKMTLSQIEGLDLLLNANSNFISNQGFSLLSGNLQEAYIDLNKNFLNHKSAVELSIDFLDDVGEEEAKLQFKQTLDELKISVSKLKDRIFNQSYSLINPDIILTGLPNSGKSSLFNLLLNENRSIVTEIAGTTRDFITENILFKDINYRLIDTAGIRDEANPIEKIGIEKVTTLLHNSFFKILVINPFNYDETTDLNYDFVIFTHKDLENFELRRNEIEIGNLPFIELSLVQPNISIERMIEVINEKYLSVISNNPITLDRHVQLINKITLMLGDYSKLSGNCDDVSILSSELNILGYCISELIGIVSTDDVLQNIFQNFCIGK